MLKAIESGLSKINQPIAVFFEKVGGFLLLAMTIIVLAQVLFRYILNMPLAWTDEASRFLMIYMTYLALPIVYLRDQNIAMTFMIDAISGTRVLHLVNILIHIIAIVVFLYWTYFGWGFFENNGGVSADSLPINMSAIYIIPPVMLAFTCLSAVQKIIGELDRFVNFQPAAEKEAA